MIYKPLVDKLEENGYVKSGAERQVNDYIISFSSVYRRVQVSAVIYIKPTLTTQDTHTVFDTFTKIAEAVILERVDGFIAVSYEISLRNPMSFENQNLEQYIITINYDKIFNQTNYL